MIVKTIQNSYEFNRDALKDDKIINTLTKNELKIHKSFNLQDIHPEYYKSTAHLICIGMEMCKVALLSKGASVTDDNGVKIQTQISRSAGSRDIGQQKALHRSVHDNGWLLHTLPLQGYRDENGEIHLITGNSRLEELVNYNFDEVYINIWEGNENSTPDEIFHDRDYLGLLFNPSPIHQAHASEIDLISYGVRQVKSGFINSNIDEITAEMSKLITKAGYGEGRKSYILAKILESTSRGSAVVIPMRKAEILEFRERAGDSLLDTKGRVKYIFYSYNRVAQCLQNTIKFSIANPTTEVRIVVHAGVLTGDPVTEYDSRIKAFYNDMIALLGGVSKVLYNSADVDVQLLKHKNTPPRWSVYAAAPSVSSVHNLSKLNIFDQEKGDGSFV